MIHPDMNQIVGQTDIVFITFDTLRFDVAQEEWAAGSTPNLARSLGPEGWQARHTPGSFTWAAHQAFFAGFLPTPIAPGKHPRLFATRFEGATSVDTGTYVVDAPDIVTGLRAADYHTICIGGTGFFNQRTPLSKVLPALFDEAHWHPEIGVTGRDSARLQFDLAAKCLGALPADKRAFLFINVSAMHQPNRHYLDPAPAEDCRESHAAALRYVDTQWPRLVAALAARGGAFCIACADHGTAYGDDGYHGHRIAHPVVWTVPYANFGVPSA